MREEFFKVIKINARFPWATLVPASIISFFLAKSLVNLLSPLEFDTAVFLSLSSFFAKHGIPLSPVVLSDTGIVCGINQCDLLSEDFRGHEFLTPNYTSGFLLLAGSAFLMSLGNLGYFDMIDLGQPVVAYSVLISAFVFTSVLILSRASQLTKPNVISLIIITALSIMFLLPFSGDRVVGEFLSSISLSICATTLFFQLTGQRTFAGLSLISLILGIAVETKLSSLFTAFFLQVGVFTAAWGLQNRWLAIFSCGLTFTVPKLISIGIISSYLAWDFDLIYRFFEASNEVAKYNANAGLNWKINRFESRWNMVKPYQFVVVTVFLTTILLAVRLIWVLRSGHYKEILGPALIAILLFVSLSFSLIYKFPYPRLLSQLVALLPLCLLVSIWFCVGPVLRRWVLAPVGLISLLLVLQSPVIRPAYAIDIPRYMEFERDDNGELDFMWRELSKSDSLALVDGFFGTPWDLIYQLNRNGVHDIRFVSTGTPLPDLNVGQRIMFVSSCRYGWCSTDLAREVPVNTNPPIALSCDLIHAGQFYRLRECSISNTGD